MKKNYDKFSFREIVLISLCIFRMYPIYSGIGQLFSKELNCNNIHKKNITKNILVGINYQLESQPYKEYLNLLNLKPEREELFGEKYIIDCSDDYISYSDQELLKKGFFYHVRRDKNKGIGGFFLINKEGLTSKDPIIKKIDQGLKKQKFKNTLAINEIKILVVAHNQLTLYYSTEKHGNFELNASLIEGKIIVENISKIDSKEVNDFFTK